MSPVGIVKIVGSLVQSFMDQPTFAFAFATVVLVMGYRMDRNKSNTLLIVALVLFCHAIFRASAVPQLTFAYRLLVTLGGTLVIGTLLYYFLWAESITPNNVQKYIQRWNKEFKLNGHPIQPAKEQKHAFGYEFGDVTVAHIQEYAPYITAFARVPVSDWAQESYHGLTHIDQLRFYAKFRSELYKARLYPDDPGSLKEVKIWRTLQIDSLKGLTFLETLQDIDAGTQLVTDTINLQLVETLERRGPTTPDNVESQIERWAKNFGAKVGSLPLPEDFYFGYSIWISDNRPIKLFRRKDRGQCLIFEVGVQLDSLKETWKKLSDEETHILGLELESEFAKSDVPCNVNFDIGMATVQRQIPILGLTEVSFVQHFNRSHRDGIIVRDTILLKLKYRR